jgi:two-component system, NarL family, sensor histidine kinase DesK
LQQLPSAGLAELSWDFSYTVALTALGVIGLYGAAGLIRLLGELDMARDAHVRYAIEAEGRRAWGDVHNVLRQALTAIMLKADLARRMISRAPQQSLAELDEVIELAAEQAHELGVIARGERDVNLDAEVDNAIALLRAAGIEVSTELGAGDLDESTSGLLGWAAREGTTNILRHARARRVWIRAERESDRVVLELRNDGVRGGMSSGTGLRGLAERAAAESGQAAGRIVPGGQFVLRVTVPERVRV